MADPAPLSAHELMPTAPRRRVTPRGRLEQAEAAFARALAKSTPFTQGMDVELRDSLASIIAANAALLLRVPSAEVAEVMQQLRPPPNAAIDQALGAATEAHLEALRSAGLTSSMVGALRSLLQVTIDARVMQAQVELRRVLQALQQRMKERASPPPLLTADPTESVNARELGRALGDVSEDTVRLREGRGELFSILRPGRKRGREYPAFQAWEGIAGAPLAQVLEALGRPNGPDAYGFFTSPTELLGGLTPLEAMLGRMTSVRDVDAAAEQFLLEPADRRLATVLQVARTEADILRA